MAKTAANINHYLTNYAVGYAQDLGGGIADFLMPQAEVPGSVGQYKIYDSKDAFLEYDTHRPAGGKATRIHFTASDGTIACLPQALEVAIDDDERSRAGATGEMALEQAKIRTLINAATVAHERKVLTYLGTAVSATGSVGNWSSGSTKPIDEIDSVIETIAKNSGRMPNRIAMGLNVWRVLKNHANVINRFAGASRASVSISDFAGLLLNPQIQIKVGVLGYDTTKKGATASKAFIAADVLYVFYASDTPDQYDPTFAKTFTTKRGGVESVRQYRDEPFSDMYLVDWSEQLAVTASAAGAKIAYT